MAMVVVLPLIFSTAVESMFDAVKSAAFRIIGGIFISSALFYLWNKLKQPGRKILINKYLDISVLFILFSMIISTVFSINPYVSLNGQYARQIGLITYIMLALIYFSASFILDSAEKRNKLLLAMEITAGLVAAYSILQYMGLDPFYIQKLEHVRPISSLGTSVFAAGLLTIVFPFTAIRIIQNKFSITYFFVPAVILAGIVISQTRTAYAALLVEIILLVIFYPNILKHDNIKFIKARKTGLIILGLVILFVISVNILLPQNIYVKRFQSIIFIAETQRWVLWETTLKMFRKYPFSGTGISTFSRGIEDFITIALKSREIRGYYDNAHNNFLHTLAISGIVGLTAYLFMLFNGIKFSVAQILLNNDKKKRPYIFIAFLCMFGGYIIYGLADFDEITILVYLFVFLAVLKPELHDAGKGTFYKPDLNNHQKIKRVFSFALVLVVLFNIYNIYSAYIDIKADRKFTEAFRSLRNGNIIECNSNLDEAIELNPRAEYLYSYAYSNYIYCFDNPVLSDDGKKQLLAVIESQVKRAIKNHPSEIQCLGLLSLVKYEEGDTAEGNKLRDIVLTKDTLQTDYRVDLSRYYFKSRREDLALEQLKIVYKYDPRNIDAYLTSVVYLIQKKEYNSAENCCNTILRMEPGNPEAIKYLNEIRRLKSINN